MVGYNDVPEWVGYCPACPKCKTTMGFSLAKQEYKCPSCGYIMDIDDWDEDDLDDEEDEDGIPFGCSACGGPYPDCISSCNMFDEDD